MTKSDHKLHGLNREQTCRIVWLILSYQTGVKRVFRALLGQVHTLISVFYQNSGFFSQSHVSCLLPFQEKDGLGEHKADCRNGDKQTDCPVSIRSEFPKMFYVQTLDGGLMVHLGASLLRIFRLFHHSNSSIKQFLKQISKTVLPMVLELVPFSLTDAGLFRKCYTLALEFYANMKKFAHNVCKLLLASVQSAYGKQNKSHTSFGLFPNCFRNAGKLRFFSVPVRAFAFWANSGELWFPWNPNMLTTEARKLWQFGNRVVGRFSFHTHTYTIIGAWVNKKIMELTDKGVTPCWNCC